MAVATLGLHLCLHATYQHLFMQGVRPLCDIAEMVAHHEAQIDWDAFCQRSMAWGWAKGTYLALYLSHTLLSAAIPAQVLATLQPADIPPQLIETAKAHLFVANDELGMETSVNFMQVVSERPLLDKAKLLLDRFVLSRQELAHAYKVPVDSPRLYLYYPVRFWDLLVRYHQKAWRYFRGETALASAAQQRNRLVEWLGQA